ncbi:LysE family translocator [Cochlodiniinecator piscidefendens]|uniref:LysE family translocator n=1 Tax=Cochlodiniinecator piscidefendens TaxID=2715756 RepID=UPI001409D3EB|nr:LysE family translocator [Cochlodiniinecator piscidefendens]
MIPFDVLSLFFVTAIALGLAPGPDNIFVLTQSALYGRKPGIVVTLGLCTGLIMHTAAVALGVAAIFETSALAFTVLKIIGAGYLIYLAWGAFRAGAADLQSAPAPQLGLRKLYWRGVVMNITNPKIAIFFLAFLPQFADPARGSISGQILILGVVFIVSTTFVFGAIAWGAGFLGDWLKRSPQAQTIMNRVAGVIFVGLALKLLTANRT